MGWTADGQHQTQGSWIKSALVFHIASVMEHVLCAAAKRWMHAGANYFSALL